MRLVHVGKGRIVSHETPPFIDLSTAVPSARQKLKLKRVGSFALRNPVSISIKHTNYQPGQFHDLGDDQCRNITVDEKNLRCGKRVRLEWVRRGRLTCDDCAKFIYQSAGAK
jgi:hypothetical protein